MNKTTNFKRTKSIMCLLMLIVLIQSCIPIRLINVYDEITDNAVTELQEKVSVYFVQLERDLVVDINKAKYENFTKQLDEIKVDLNTIEVRANAFEKNRIMSQQVQGLKNMIENLEILHKQGFTNVNQIKPLKKSFNVAFTAIIKFQLALKRGKKN
ncbi:hypothetical protein [Tenacibaculum aiptasiae]|uniref:hypothetical protein n=1 Tax=Tenacibaculum aiptasiae TaxID=426481 RepID=UPI00232AAFBA|nr:hypothetical protein [Tenacibaculum aiptasiae]